MNRLRCAVLGLSLSFLTVSVGWTGDDSKRSEPPPSPDTLPFGASLRPLLTPGMQEKLKLTAEQKDKIQQIVKDFESQQKQAATKIRQTMKKATQEGKPELFHKIGEQYLELQESLRKQRVQAESKLKGLLTAEQKKKYEELQAPLPTFSPPPLQPPAGAQPRYFSFGVSGPSIGQMVPVPLQEMLKLTVEQRKAIEKIRKDAEAKIREVLTEEQKKQLEKWKKRSSPPAPPQPAHERPRKG